jgi:hypothetical protein
MVSSFFIADAEVASPLDGGQAERRRARTFTRTNREPGILIFTNWSTPGSPRTARLFMLAADRHGDPEPDVRAANSQPGQPAIKLRKEGTVCKTPRLPKLLAQAYVLNPDPRCEAGAGQRFIEDQVV